MYEVIVKTHFECWYVSDDIIQTVDTFEEALDIFCRKCKDGFEDYYLGLDNFINECFKDDASIDEWGKGFMIKIENDDYQIVRRYFEYDKKSHSVDKSNEIELDHENLAEGEIAILANYVFN